MVLLKSLKARVVSVGMAAILAAAMAGFTLPQQAYADETVTVSIESQTDLANWLASSNTGSNVVVNLEADGLDVTSPLANFAGTFNGNGHTLDLAISTAADNTAFIGNLASTGKIDNVKFSGSVVSTTSGDYVAAAVGYNSGTISNVTNAATVTAESAYNVGGIAGFNNQGTISNCSNAAVVKGYVKVGGMVGENAGTIQDCANFGKVTSDYNRKCGVGGIAGRNGDNNTPTETGIIKNCANTGDVICSDGSWVGGIAGFQNALSKTEGCTVSETCTIDGYNYVGRYIGKDEGTTSDKEPVIGGTATLTGGTVADLQTAIAAAGADGTIKVTGTVTLDSSVTIHNNVNIIREAGFSGPMFKVATGSSDVYVTLTSMTLDGNKYGPIFDINSGRLRLRGNIKLQNADTAVVVENGGVVEVNKASVTGTDYSFDVKAGGTLIYNDFGGTSISGTVYLENTAGQSDANLELASALGGSVVIKCANPSSGLIITTTEYDPGTNLTYADSTYSIVSTYSDSTEMYTIKLV